MADLCDAIAMYDEDHLRFFASTTTLPEHGAHIGGQRSDIEADLIWRLLRLQPGMKVLDLA